jgi:hypothetical protein
MSRSKAGILNYTTTVSASKTVLEICQILSKAKCQAIMQEFHPNGRAKAVSFRINTAFGIMTFQLPANVDGVWKRIQRDSILPYSKRTFDQAERVAWRILKDWTEAQCAMIQVGLADMEQVFLPYAQRTDGLTLYENLKMKQFDQLALPAA